MKRRIGILTAGGDCPGLNACIRGVARASYSLFDTKIVGIQDGYAGLIEGNYREMKQSDFSGILTLGGTILNFFLYTVLGNVNFTFYPVRLAVCVLAFAVSAFGCTMVLETHLMRTPMEGCIQMIAERIGTTMGKLRQKIDIVLVLVSVALTLIFGTEWTLREGTIIAALIFGPAMDFWKKNVFSKWKL